MSISKLTDILVILTLTIIICVTVFLFLRDNTYYMILSFVLLVVADSLYVIIKIIEKSPPRDTGHYP
jgi:FtsH-binding integral membrane protein